MILITSVLFTIIEINAQWITANVSMPMSDFSQIAGKWNNQIFLFAGSNYPDQSLLYDINKQIFTQNETTVISSQSTWLGDKLRNGVCQLRVLANFVEFRASKL